ncbi:MAG: amidohydrolase [Eubacteriales bacterium]
MNIRFFNARVLTMKPNEDIFMGEIWIQDEKIIYVGKGNDFDSFFRENQFKTILWDQEIDCEGNVLMPGFKNPHTHSGMTVFRSMCDDLNLQDWLHNEIFPREAKMTKEDCYHLTKLAILEYLTSGVTAIGDMYIQPEATVKACKEMGMRCAAVSGLNLFVSSIQEMEERFLALNDQHPLIQFKMAVHAEYTCSKELLEEVSKLTHKYQAPLYAHMSETEAEVQDCINKYGMTPPVLFDSLGLFDFGGSIYHGVYPTKEDLEIFKKRRITVVSNPASNAKLASGIVPITTYIEEGIPVAIGTDGASSNNCLDMFREMFLVTAFANLREKNPAAVDAMEVLRMATVNGAVSMGMLEADVLGKGKLADIIMIDLHQPNMQPLNHISKNIVYSGSKQNIKMTMIHGEMRYYKGQFIGCEDVERIYQKANEIRQRLR